MLSNYETNFYIRRDADDLLWSGISVNIPNKKYNSYKLSCFIKKGKKDSWKPEQVELIIFDNLKNMYRISAYDIDQLYNKRAKDKDIPFIADLSRFCDQYMNVESYQVSLNELLLKNLIDELKIKAEQSFGVKIKI